MDNIAIEPIKLDTHSTNFQRDYEKFLQSKSRRLPNTGKQISRSEIHPILFEFQKDVTTWAVRKGRAAIFLDTGLGKTFCSLEWARLIGENTLIIAPLSVSRQTIREGKKIGLEVRYVRSDEEVTGDNKLWITNYENIDNFNFSRFGAVVLDESSILKCYSGHTRRRLTNYCKDIPYRLACTATPAPNDNIEIGNHAEFLGICTQAEMLAMFFVNANKEHTYLMEDGRAFRRKGSNKGGTEWRLKHHAEKPFYAWLSSWAITMTKPSDLGYDDNGFILPKLDIKTYFIDVDYTPEDQLFFTGLKGIQDRAKIRGGTVEEKIETLRSVLDTDKEGQWIIWAGLDKECSAIVKAVPGIAEVKGNDKPDYKAETFEAFQDGKIRILLSKPSIAGYGMNFQNAHNMIFFGLNDSWETWYQAIRREWRFGQVCPVNVHVIMSSLESEIYANIKRKDAMATRLRSGLIEHIIGYSKGELEMVETRKSEYKEDTIKEGDFIAMLGDSCLRLKEIESNSVDLSVYSPPFADLYTYTDSEHDLGNSRNSSEFFEHYRYIISELLRVTKPGRLSCVHVSDIPAMAQKDGFIGVKDFPGDVIRAHQEAGWIFYGRAFVQKNPQALRNGTPVLTPDGWVAIDKLQKGDAVVGSSGRFTLVSGVYHHPQQQLYRITFSDGCSIDCHSEHLWTIGSYKSNPAWKTVTTESLYSNGVTRKSGTPKYRIPIIKSPVVFSDNPYGLPIDPYLMGVLLGDGSISQDRTIEICTDEEIILKLKLPENHSIVFRPGGDRANGTVRTAAIVCEDWHRNDILSALRNLDLQGKRAWEKFIPPLYLLDSVENRRQLLCGLLDTDGTVKRTGSILYSTTSERLSEDIRELVLSLGGIALVSKSDGSKYNHNGEDRYGREIFNIFIQLPGEQNPFSLKRKADKWHPRQRGFWRSITGIEKIDIDDCTCITVHAQDGLFVTENYVVTHNSQAIRTKAKALLFVQLRKDSSDSRPALIDQILIFKKPGDTAVPVEPVKNGEIDNETWIEWAHGIWIGINESDTLQFTTARDGDDEKHICPLQLGTIERCVKLYSNPGETVLTPFMGIGSEAYTALRFGRKAIGIELKPSYFAVAVKNLRRADASKEDLFKWAERQKQVEGLPMFDK